MGYKWVKFIIKLVLSCRCSDLQSFIRCLHFCWSIIWFCVASLVGGYLNYALLQYRSVHTTSILSSGKCKLLSVSSCLVLACGWTGRSLDCAFCIATGYVLDDWRVGVWFSVGSRIFSTSRPALRPTNLLPIGNGGLFPRGYSGKYRKLTTHIQLVPRSRKYGSIHPLPHTSSWRSAELVKRRDNFTFTYTDVQDLLVFCSLDLCMGCLRVCCYCVVK
jgi:hypothetical protein